MLSPDHTMDVGPFQVRLGTVAAFFYLHQSEIAPDNADDDWFLPVAEPVIDFEHVQQFLVGLGNLLSVLIEASERSDMNSLLGHPPEFTKDLVQTEFYEAAKSTFGTEKADIREFFRMMYLVVTQTPSGPRWSEFVLAYGLEDFVSLIQRRLTGTPCLPRIN